MLICERLDTTDSTQREVLRRLSGVQLRHPPGAEASGQILSSVAPFGVWTTRQTQGIASHGRSWVDSPDGGLALSIAWPAPMDSDGFAAWPVRWSLLVMTTLEATYPVLANRLGVKWPNDVMANNAKLAGVLVSRHLISGQWWWVAGVGINLAWHQPPALGRPVTDLESLGVVEPDPEKIVAAIANATLEALGSDVDHKLQTRWQTEYRRRDVAADMPVEVVHPTTGVTLAQGINRGITANGELALEVDGDQRIIAVGELSLRLPCRAAPSFS